MHTRLLSFFNTIENALAADEPAPDDGTWQTSRTINYHQGVARLSLAVLKPDHSTLPRGEIQLQSFELPDGSICLRATLGWDGSDAHATHSIYEKPGLDWKREARRIASNWLAGAPAPLAEMEPAVEAPAGRLAASG